MPVLLLLGLFLFSGPSLLEAAEPQWSAAEEGVVESVLSGDTLLLQDGRELRLVGVRVPRAPLAYQDAGVWRQEETARLALETRVPPGQAVRFLRADPAHDRHRRLLVQARNSEGLWLQESLLAAGNLLLDRPTGVPPDRLRLAEQEARAARRGLWSDPAHAPVAATAADGIIGRFALVEGRVLVADEVRGVGYLNFGEDWRKDFTIRLPRSVLRQLEARGQPIGQFAGRAVSARGWVFYSGGPMIEVRDLSEIVIIDE